MESLKQLGGFLVIAGLISSGLHLINYELRYLLWIDKWGEGIGWTIRAGFIVVGALLFMVGAKAGSEEPTGESGEEPTGS